MEISLLQINKKYADILIPSLDLNEDKSEKKDKGIFCAFCENLITSFNNKINISGNHIHIFTNPNGFIYEIGIFSEAEGCIVYGEPVSIHSWFPPYKWNFAMCNKCGSHLGWHFQIVQNSFFGLILKNIIQQ